MILECPHCGKEYDGSISKINEQWFSLCPECVRLFDIEVPNGRIVMAFAWDETDEFFTDDWFDSNAIATYYAFDTPAEFIRAWKKMSEEPDGMWYWLLDNGKCFCSGACDPGDVDIIMEHFAKELNQKGETTMKKNGREKFSITAEMKIILTTEDIDDIMVGALEGGINYWCGEAEVIEEKRVAEWGHEQIARGGVLMLHDIEDPDEVWELTLEKFLKGFRLWVENGCDTYGAVQNGTVDCCEIDAACADEIIQYSLFGKIVFG